VRISTRVHRNDDPLAFLTAIASGSSPSSRVYTASEHVPKQHLVAFTSSPASQTATSTTPVLIFGSEDVRVKEVEEALKLRLGVKSGGKGPRWSECRGLPKRGDG
jgi:misacylated tRNA(Ala) deacylase